MIVGHDRRRVPEVIENRENATVRAYLAAAKTDGLLAAVEEVTTDMWDAYVDAAREVFGDRAAITIDRFHGIKNFPDGPTAARREVQRGLPGTPRPGGRGVAGGE